MARASSPISTRRNENIRRNSFNSPKCSNNSEDDSDESESSFEDETALYSRNNSLASANSSSLSHLNESRNNGAHLSLSHTAKKRNVEQEAMYQSSNKSSSHLKLISSTVITIVAVIAMYRCDFFISNEISDKVVYDKNNFYNDVKGVGEKYKISDNSILQVRAGIATIFERQDTGSFIFAYNSDRSNFNPVNFNNFVNELASAAARYLRNDTKTVHHVVVDTSHLRVQTDKELMNEYLADVDKTGVMLVKELDKIPSTLAMAFHYYCDEYNPLVKKSAIFFTLNMARCSNVSSEKYTHEKIEKCLANKWEEMPQDNIRPLLTRVVNVVIDVTTDF